MLRRIFTAAVPHQQLARFPPIDSWQPPPLDHALAVELSQQTSGVGPRTPGHPSSLARPSSANGSATPRGGVMSPASLLLLRESGGGPLAPCQRAHFAAFHRLPTRPSSVADQMQSRAYIGRFTASGDLFVGE